MDIGRRLLNGRRNLNAEVVRGDLGLATMKSRWSGVGARLRWKKLLEGSLATWVYKWREAFVLSGTEETGVGELGIP